MVIPQIPAAFTATTAATERPVSHRTRAGQNDDAAPFTAATILHGRRGIQALTPPECVPEPVRSGEEDEVVGEGRVPA